MLVEVMSRTTEPGGDPLDLTRFTPTYPGVTRVIPAERVRYTNKAGRAYGFHTENALIEDLETGRAFAVTATIYVNENRILNDDEYEYEEISYPFFVDLGEVLAESGLRGRVTRSAAHSVGSAHRNPKW